MSKEPINKYITNKLIKILRNPKFYFFDDELDNKSGRKNQDVFNTPRCVWEVLKIKDRSVTEPNINWRMYYLKIFTEKLKKYILEFLILKLKL